MEYSRAKKMLDSIQQLFDNIDPQNAVSALELDLIKDYTRKFYDALGSGNPSSSSPKVDLKPSIKADVDSAARLQKIKASYKVPQKDSSFSKPAFSSGVSSSSIQFEEAKVETAKVEEKVVFEKPRIIQIPEEVEEDVQQIEQQKEPSTSQPVSNPVVEQPVYKEVKPAVDKMVSIPSEIEDLFFVKTGGDLSDRLAGSPIQDLSRAMSLNEILLYRSELFGGQKSSMDEAVLKLNTFSSFEEAKQYLGTKVAQKNDWANSQKSNIAKDFIKLVRRRYA